MDEFGPVVVITADGTSTGYLTADDAIVVEPPCRCWNPTKPVHDWDCPVAYDQRERDRRFRELVKGT